MFCKKCGREIPDTNKFCQYCGVSLVQPTVSSNNVDRAGYQNHRINKITVMIMCSIAVICLIVVGITCAMRLRVNNKYNNIATAEQTDDIEIKEVIDGRIADEDIEERVETQHEEELVANGIDEIGQDDIDEITYEKNEKLLKEAINIFPMCSIMISDSEEVGWIVDNFLINCSMNNTESYAGLNLLSGRAESPKDFDVYGISKGSELEYAGVNSDELGIAIASYYGEAIYIPIGDILYETCIGDEEKVLEWGSSYLMSYEYGVPEFTVNKEYNENNNYIIEGQWSVPVDPYSNPKVQKVKLVFDENPNSIYGYSITEYSLEMSQDDITKEESRIRSSVNSGVARKVEVPAGKDRIKYARWYLFEGDKLIFSYYYAATDESEDQRYYFKDNKLIEWIDGSDSNTYIRNYLSDSVLADGWEETEKEVLEDAYSNYGQ